MCESESLEMPINATVKETRDEKWDNGSKTPVEVTENAQPHHENQAMGTTATDPTSVNNSDGTSSELLNESQRRKKRHRELIWKLTVAAVSTGAVIGIAWLLWSKTGPRRRLRR